MEIDKPNYLQTSTQITVNSGTSTAENLLDRDRIYQYLTSGLNDDTTTNSITISFDETMAVSRIVLDEMNWKDFTVFYNGATASTFSLTSTGATTTSDFSSNSETSMVLRFASVNCTSVTFDVQATQVANSEKAIGSIVLTTPRLIFERTPSADSYEPSLIPEEVVHRLSDGGTRVQTLSDKWNVVIFYEHATSAFRSSLRDVWNLHSEHYFLAFPTTTGWDRVGFSCVWPGNFDFEKFSDNAADAGHSGGIRLLETPD